MAIQIVGDRFILEPGKPLGGGTARVYKARDHQTGQIVTVKILEGWDDDELAKEFFFRETEALTALRHPNIVEMLASGFDDELYRYFVVLEWMDYTLPTYLKEVPPEGWDSFAEAVVIPILKGLALAHSRHIIHRDIKPPNILVNSDGVPKLADFGIAKLASLRMGMTVRDFASRHYAPPEYGEYGEEASFRGDLFSLGVTILECLVPQDFKITHHNLEEAIWEADLPPNIADFIGKLVAINPEDRPLTAEVALVELERLQRGRPQDLSSRPVYNLEIPKTVAEKLARLLRCGSRTELQQAILLDLSEHVAVDLYEGQQDLQSGETYLLLGQELSYHVAIERNHHSTLVILNALQLLPSHLEYKKERAMPLCDFSK